MAKYIAIRLAQFPLILAAIYLITFLLAWVAPGDPFQNTDRKLQPEVLAQLKARFHAEDAWSFLTYYPVRLIVHRDFGPSMVYEEWPVGTILGDALPVSATIGLFALAVASAGGVALGTLAGVRRGGAVDWASLSVTLIGISLPSFVIASVLFAGFSSRLRWFPIGHWGSFQDVVLPGLALSLMPMAYIARLTRVSMIDVLGSDYVRTGRAKGLSRNKVVWKHALRNALLPVLSYLGPAAASTLVGSFVVEKVFNIPGLGQHFVQSVLNRDQTLILGTVMVYSTFLLILNLLVDIGYVLVDPRIDVTAQGGDK
ncbi:MAG TPA: ABC transporter permease [Humisphaera sp.]